MHGRLRLFQPERGSAARHRREQDEVATGRSSGDRRVGACEEHGAVGLPPAERVPLGVGVSRHEQDGVVRGFRPREESGIAVGAFVAAECVHAAESRELEADRRGQAIGVEVVAQRNDREDTRPRRRRRQAPGDLQLAGDLAEERS